MCLKIALYSLFRQPEFCLIFILSKSKSFIENISFISFHGGIWSRYSGTNTFKTRKDLPKTTKTHYKKQISKATSSIRRLSASLDIHYKNSLNTEVKKQNETKIKKLQTKVADSMIFGINCNTFFSKNKLLENLVV